MDGHLANLITLACFGNHVTRGGSCPNLLQDHKAYQYQEYFNFSIHRKRLFDKHARTYVADDPNEWFQYLIANQCKGILLDYSDANQPDEARTNSGFVGGGGSWVLLTSYGSNVFDAWEAVASVGNRNAADNRIWQTTCHRISERFSMTPPVYSLGYSSKRLLPVLKDAHSFALRNTMPWTEHFQNAIDTLVTNQLKQMYIPCLCPPESSSSQALALLDACQSAWVFGGMGSWNDPWITEGTHQEYEAISRELWASLIQGILAAVNSTYPEY